MAPSAGSIGYGPYHLYKIGARKVLAVVVVVVVV